MNNEELKIIHGITCDFLLLIDQDEINVSTTMRRIYRCFDMGVVARDLVDRTSPAAAAAGAHLSLDLMFDCCNLIAFCKIMTEFVIQIDNAISITHILN